MKKSGTKKRVGRPSKSQSNVPAFLQKTFEFLDVPEYSHLISWNAEGNAFIVKNISGFADEVLPKYFKHNNFASFVRQLNMYDFHKIRHEDNENEFRHKFFKKGQRNLLSQIKRKSHEPLPDRFEPLASTNRTLELSKVKKETQHFSTELGIIKGRQSELEKVVKTMSSQNQKLTDENKLLWGELVKNREKYENKMEKMMLFLCSFLQNQDSRDALDAFQGKKALPNSETFQQALQKFEQSDLAKTEGDLIKAPQNQKAKREGELTTSTPFNLRRRQNQNQNTTVDLQSVKAPRKVTGKRPLPTKEPLDDPSLKEMPTKQVKLEQPMGQTMNPAPFYSFSTKPVNMENDFDLPLQPSLSRVMSINDQFGATSVNSNRFGGFENDFFSSPKPFQNGNKIDDEFELGRNGFKLDNNKEESGFGDSAEPMFSSNLFPDNNMSFPFGEDTNLSLKHQNSEKFLP